MIYMRMQVLYALAAFLVAATGDSQTVYSYVVPQGGYTATGDLHAYTDSVNGSWSLSYDPLNRVQGASASAGPYSGLTLQWTYDSFGNRLSQQNTGSPPTSGSYSSWGHFTDGSNRVTATNQAPAPNGILYDAAGNITFDGVNNYAYDGENRLCASSNSYGITQYVYDAEGRRVAKVSASSLTCYSGSTTPAVTATYVLGEAGEQVTEFNGAGAWQHTNVYAGGQLLATYKSDNNMYFPFTDPLGTTRVWAPAVGTTGETCSGLPFGDVQSCSGTDPSEQHFTGKERDSESGLDNFGARYYASTMGRFISPDPSGPYFANLTNPQSLNLYGYAQNNPLTNTDPTGLDCVYFNDAGTGVDGRNGIDHNSNSAECGANGGDWVNGTTSASQVQYNANNDTFNIRSSSAFHNYDTTAKAPGSQSDGTSCFGNCDTAGGYKSSFRLPGFTVQVGVAGNLGITGPITGVGSAGLVFDSHGRIATYITGGGGLSAGAGSAAGVQFGVLNGNGVCALGGPFYNASTTAGVGPGATADGFAGQDASNNIVAGGSVTLGLGVGASASGTYTGTQVTPLGGEKCQ